MKERSQIPELTSGLFSRNHQSPVAVRRTRQRYDLAQAMNSQKGVLNSPAFRANSNRLDSDSLLHLPGHNKGQPGEMSHRSKRSLSINTNRIAKVVKIQED